MGKRMLTQSTARILFRLSVFGIVALPLYHLFFSPENFASDFILMLRLTVGFGALTLFSIYQLDTGHL